LTVVSQYAGASIRNARLFEEVDATRRELQVLSRELVEVQESERLTLASELHDEIGQYLTALQISLARAASGPADRPPGSLVEAQQLVGNLMQKVRDLSLDLRPPMLDTLGLLAALSWHFERYTSATSVRVHFDQHGIDRRFAHGVETAVYRIIQEALTNVARAAGVEEVAVGVWATPCCIEVEVRDVGAGFNPTQAPEGISGGLVGMRQRAAALGGRLRVEATAGAGVSVTALLPFDPDYHERYHADLRHTRG
jgi:signal transduction histidine kinase